MDTNSTLSHVTVDHFDEIIHLHRAAKPWVELTSRTHAQLSGRFTNRSSPRVEHDLEESILRTVLPAAPEDLLSRGSETF